MARPSFGRRRDAAPRPAMSRPSKRGRRVGVRGRPPSLSWGGDAILPLVPLQRRIHLHNHHGRGTPAPRTAGSILLPPLLAATILLPWKVASLLMICLGSRSICLVHHCISHGLTKKTETFFRTTLGMTRKLKRPDVHGVPQARRPDGADSLLETPHQGPS